MIKKLPGAPSFLLSPFFFFYPISFFLLSSSPPPTPLQRQYNLFRPPKLTMRHPFFSPLNTLLDSKIHFFQISPISSLHRNPSFDISWVPTIQPIDQESDFGFGLSSKFSCKIPFSIFDR